MQGVIGRTASCMQSDNGIHKAAFIQHFANRLRGALLPGQLDDALGCGNCERVPQIIMRMDKGGAGKMQPHHLHQHLV